MIAIQRRPDMRHVDMKLRHVDMKLRHVDMKFRILTICFLFFRPVKLKNKFY